MTCNRSLPACRHHHVIQGPAIAAGVEACGHTFPMRSASGGAALAARPRLHSVPSHQSMRRAAGAGAAGPRRP